MSTLIVTVEDGREESVKKILNEIPYVKAVAEDENTSLLQEPPTQYQKIKQILDEAKGKNLFKDIEDPSEWQRQIRKEWDRDF